MTTPPLPRTAFPFVRILSPCCPLLCHACLVGALHVHALLWVQGLDPSTLQRCVDDAAAVRAVSQRLDAMVSQSMDPAVVAACESSVESKSSLHGSKGIDGAATRACDVAGDSGPVPDPRTQSVRVHVAPPPGHLGVNWRQFLAPLPPGAPVTEGDTALRFSAEQYDAYLTYVLLAVGVHNHSRTCHKGGRGEECCRLAYPAGCWDTLPTPVELLRAADGTVLALRALSPSAMANPPGEHNPYFPLARPDSRVITWEMFRPSEGVSRDEARAELDAYLARCKDKVDNMGPGMASCAAADEAAAFGDWGQGMAEHLAALQDGGSAAVSALAAWNPGDAELAVPSLPQPSGAEDPALRRAPGPWPSASDTFPQDKHGPNQKVVPHSRVLTACVRCNTSVNLLLNQDASRCASFYLAKYVCVCAPFSLTLCVMHGARPASSAHVPHSLICGSACLHAVWSTCAGTLARRARTSHSSFHCCWTPTLTCRSTPPALRTPAPAAVP